MGTLERNYSSCGEEDKTATWDIKSLQGKARRLIADYREPVSTIRDVFYFSLELGTQFFGINAGYGGGNIG